MSKSEHFKKELEYIKSDKIRNACKEMIELLPDYFFEIPASSTGKYHPEYALGKGGLLRHTKAAVRIAYELLGDECIGNKYTADEKDLMIMALILHDGLKSGYDHEKYTRFDHPILMADYIMDNEEKKDIEIVSGDGTNLNISPVYDNLDIAKPDEDTNAKKNVVIPDVKK